MCWWPCCHRAIFRIDGSTGAKIWQKDWGPSLSFFGDVITSVDTDGTYIFAGGLGRASPSGDPADAFNVRALDEDGNTIWETDVGGAVREVQFVSGVGVVVSHDVSHEVADPVLIQNLGAASNFFITDEFGVSGTISSAASAATVESTIEGLDALLSGNVSVSGSDFVSGFSVQYDSSLGSTYTGRRPMLLAGRLSANFHDVSMQSSSMANLTALDESDGSVIWSVYVGQIQPYTGTHGIQGAGSARAFNGGLYVGTHPSTLATGVGITKVSTAGSITGTLAMGAGSTMGGAKKTIATDGSGLYVFDYRIGGNGIQRLNTSDAITWVAPLPTGDRKLVIDGADVWHAGTGTYPIKRRSSDGVQTDSIAAAGPYQDFCVLPSSEYAVAGIGASAGVTKYDSSFAEDWEFTDTNFGRCCCAYGSDVIMGMQRV